MAIGFITSATRY